jgi:hypothetical protein
MGHETILFSVPSRRLERGFGGLSKRQSIGEQKRADKPVPPLLHRAHRSEFCWRNRVTCCGCRAGHRVCEARSALRSTFDMQQ